MAVRLGLTAKIYYCPVLNPSTGAVWNAPTPEVPGSFPTTGVPEDTANTQDMVELSNVKDVTLTLERATSDITTRAAAGWRVEAATLRTATIDFQMVWDDTDKSFQNVAWLFMNDHATVNYLFIGAFDGSLALTTTGYKVQGLYTPTVVSSMTRTESLEEALMASVSLRPTTVTSYPPTWITRTHA